MDSFDFVIIGAGPAGEAAAYKARELGATVAVDRPPLVRRELPAHRLPALEVAPRRRGATRRQPGALRLAGRLGRSATTWSTGRPDAAEPDDSSHLPRPARGGRGRLPRARGRSPAAAGSPVRHDDATHELTADERRRRRRFGLEACRRSRASTRSPTWTNREATLARELPASLLVLGGGPTGCELAQVYVRFGVPTTIVQSGPRLAPTDHPRNSEVVRAALERDGVIVRTGVRALRGAGRAPAATARTSSTSTTARPPRATRSCSRSAAPSRSTTSVSSTTASTRPGGRRSRATAGSGSRDGLWVIGDPAGPELHTHQAHYQGELAVRMALGEPVRPGLPGAAPGDVHGPRGVVGRPHAGRRLRRRARRVRARGRFRDEREGVHGPGEARATSRSSSTAARASSSARRWPAPTRPRRSTNASWPSRRTSRSTSWPRRSTRSRRRRGSSTGCSPTHGGSSTATTRTPHETQAPTPAALGLEDDPAVDQDDRRASRRQRAAGLDRLVERRRPG